MVEKALCAQMDCQLRFEIGSLLGDAHEPAHAQLWQLRDSLRERKGLLRRHASLGLATVDVDL